MSKDFNINDDIIVRYLQKQTNSEENILIKEWISLSKENKNYYTNFSNLYKASNFQKDYKEIDVNKSWRKVETRIEKIKENKKVRKLIPSKVWKVAAGLALLISFVTYQYLNTEIITITAKNNTKKVQLPDGSLVWLNQNSELSYHKKLSGKTRNIKLKGEGYFEVAKDPDKPFIVNLNNTQTKVLGTQFNLKENANKEVSLALIEGSVSFSTSIDTLIVSPGENISTNIKGKLTKFINKDLNFMSWKTGVLQFNETPLSKVLDDISKLYNVTFTIKNSEILENSLTIKFNKESLEDVLNTLKTLYGFELQLNKGNNYIIYLDDL